MLTRLCRERPREFHLLAEEIAACWASGANPVVRARFGIDNATPAAARARLGSHGMP